MKKLILSALLALFVSFSGQASASPATAAVAAAVSSNNFAAIDSYAAANPGAQGEIAMYLLQQAEAKIVSNPTLAAKLFEAAAAYVAQIPSDQSGQAANIIAAIVGTAHGDGFQSANPGATSTIFAAALNMTSQPNILDQKPNLYATVSSWAEEFLNKNPQAANKKLKEIVSLAQNPGSTPSTNNVGAFVPSAE